MSALLPLQTSVGDLCTEALKECGYLGVGQTPLAEDLQTAWMRLQWLLQQWERQRWLVFHLKNFLIPSTGAISYTVGPGGDIDTGLASARPNRVEGAFARQLSTPGSLHVDYPMDMLNAYEDYNKIRIKNLQSFPQFFFYDPAWPLGNVFFWPIPQASIYAVNVLIREQLPTMMLTQATVFTLPFEYYAAMLYNLALALRVRYQISPMPGDQLISMAKNSLNILRSANSAIASLQCPPEVTRGGIYNIFSDTNY